MKHTVKVTLTLAIFFFMAQFVGLLIINQYIDHKKTGETNKVVMKPLPYGFERPEIKNQSISFIYITISIIFGTIIVLLLAKFRKPIIWRFWFFGSVWITLSIALAAFIDSKIAIFLSLAVALLKFLRPNFIVQNISEIFVYGGLAAIFVPIFNLFAAFMLLLLISAYDYVAVFKTKHMISLARFQSDSKVFAGLFIPYKAQNGRDAKTKKIEQNNGLQLKNSSAKNSAKKTHAAVLGGGDIGFTLIFAGVVMGDLMLKGSMIAGFLKALVIPIFVTIALLVLLLKGKKNKFYPAMPILSIGCFAGYLAVLLMNRFF